MEKHKFYDGKTPYIRVNKRQARNAFNAGTPVIFCPVKLHPFGAFRPSVMMQDKGGAYRFDDHVRNYEWFNCQISETGYYTAFYLEVTK